MVDKRKNNKEKKAPKNMLQYIYLFFLTNADGDFQANFNAF